MLLMTIGLNSPPVWCLNKASPRTSTVRANNFNYFGYLPLWLNFKILYIYNEEYSNHSETTFKRSGMVENPYLDLFGTLESQSRPILSALD